MAKDLDKYITDNKISIFLYNSTILCGIDISKNEFETLYLFVDFVITPQ